MLTLSSLHSGLEIGLLIKHERNCEPLKWPHNAESKSSGLEQILSRAIPRLAQNHQVFKLLLWRRSKLLVGTSHFNIDADHIRLETVDGFLATSDFFTIDVADSIGQQPAAGSVEVFLKRHPS